MGEKIVIAVDCAGGDYAPHEMVKGAIEATEEYKVDVALVGRKAVLGKIARHYATTSTFEIIEASQSISCDESPAEAVRSKPDSSIVVGINLVRDGVASAFVSAGNTGAVLCAALFNLHRVKGIERPALCGIIHTNSAAPVLLVDAGANADCRPGFLVQFAQLGAFFARGILGIEVPRVGLLNNGMEEVKGNLLARESYQLLKNTSLNFIGNIEGQEILRGKADVIVTDGFTGNIVLKTLEGLGDTLHNFVEEDQATGIGHNLQGSALVSYAQLDSMARRMNYEEYGGASLLGINGNVVVAHGRSRAKAMKNAIHLAHRAAHMKTFEAIKEGQYLAR
jgi:glycerol-3-phosphate acyltransferase PlsX